MSIQYDLTNQLKLPNFTIRKYLIRQAEQIHQLDLYRKYIAYGWSKDIRGKLDQIVFPQIISTVASLWYSLILRHK